jgi:hypothetical protein
VRTFCAFQSEEVFWKRFHSLARISVMSPDNSQWFDLARCHSGLHQRDGIVESMRSVLGEPQLSECLQVTTKKLVKGSEQCVRGALPVGSQTPSSEVPAIPRPKIGGRRLVMTINEDLTLTSQNRGQSEEYVDPSALH